MPTNVELYDAAIELQQQGHLQQAIDKLRDLVAQDDGYALGHAALSVFYSKLDRHDEAVEHAARVCQLEPEDPFSFVAMSLICQKAGRLAEAEQAQVQARQAQYTAWQKRESQQE